MDIVLEKFTLYRNVYLLIEILPQRKKEQLSLAIIQYMFDNIEPNFIEKDLNSLWINIKMMLDKQKVKIKNGLNGGAPSGNKNAKKTTKETTKDLTEHSEKKTTNNIFNFKFYIYNFIFNKLIDKNIRQEDINELKDSIYLWVEYKNERKEMYKERGLDSLIKQIEKNAAKYGIDSLINLIDECMASNYKGIIFEKLDNKKSKNIVSNNQLSWQEKETLRQKKEREEFLRGEK